jgi:hypothetical protein
MKMTWTSILVASLLAVPAMVRSDDTACGTCTTGCSMTAASPATQPTKWVAYGEAMKLTEKDAIDAGKALADLKTYEGKNVRLTGTVNKVCSSKGCWLTMSSGGSPLEVFVKFTCPIDGHLIPQEAVGKPVVVEGKLTSKVISEDDARHIAAEAGKTKDEIEAIKGEQTQIEVQGPSALVGME